MPSPGFAEHPDLRSFAVHRITLPVLRRRVAELPDDYAGQHQTYDSSSWCKYKPLIPCIIGKWNRSDARGNEGVAIAADHEHGSGAGRRTKTRSSQGYQDHDVVGAPDLFRDNRDGPDTLPPVVAPLGYSERRAFVALHEEIQRKRNQ